MTKEIALSQQGKYKGLYVALVDDCDYERINAYRWCVMRAGNSRYAIRFVIVDGKQITILMHREVIQADDNLCVDHVDLDGLNNTRLNLRACTYAENFHNSRKRMNHTGYKGVSQTSSGKYAARIGRGGKVVYLGVFDSSESAAIAYNTAAVEMFGDFARINKV